MPRPLLRILGLTFALAGCIRTTEGGALPASSAIPPGCVAPLSTGKSPEVLASGSGALIALTLLADRVYWVSLDAPQSSYAGSVNSVPKSGGAVWTLSHGNDPKSIVADASGIYWAEATGIRRIGLQGGVPVDLATDYVGGWSVAIDSDTVYWTNDSVRSAPKAGGENSVLVAGNGAGVPTNAVANATHLYWIGGGGSIVRLAHGGDAVETVVAKADATVLAIDSGHVYWLSRNPQAYEFALKRASLSGGAPVVLTTEIQETSQLGQDCGHLFWVEHHVVRGISKDGGAIVTIATDPPTNAESFGIAADETHLYWTSGDGAVRRIAK